MKRWEDVGPWAGRPRAQTMMKAEEVKRLAREFRCSRNTRMNQRQGPRAAYHSAGPWGPPGAGWCPLKARLMPS